MKLTAFLAGIAATAAFVGTAHASGFDTYFARVSATGTVVADSGGVTAAHTSLGTYTVTFNSTVNTCGVTVSTLGTKAGFASTAFKSKDTIYVYTKAQNGTATNLPFSVFVSCGPQITARAGGIVYTNNGNPWLGTHRPSDLTVRRLGVGDYCVELPGTNLGNLAVASGDIGASGISIVTARQANGGCNGPEFLVYKWSNGSWVASDQSVFHFVVP